MLARLAVPEVKALTAAEITGAGRRHRCVASLRPPVVKERPTPPDEACIDFYLRPYDRNTGIEDAMHAYLAWEIDLVHEIERDGTVVLASRDKTDATSTAPLGAWLRPAAAGGGGFPGAAALRRL